MEKLKEFWSDFCIEEKLLMLYIIALFNMDIAAFVFRNKRILYADIVFLILFIIFVWRLVKREKQLKPTSLEIPLIIMVVLFTLSFLNSINLVSSFAELLGIIYLIILFFLISNIIETKKKLIPFLYLWMVISFIISLIGLSAFVLAIMNKDWINTQFLYYQTIESMAHHFPRIDSTFANANMFLTYLHVSLMFSIILFLFEENFKKRLFIIACISLILITAFFTGSRRFTGLLLSLFIILCFYGRGIFTSVLKNITFLFFLFFLILSVVTSIWVIFPFKVVKDENKKIVNLKMNYAYSLHLTQLVASINMIKNNPIIGVGFGTYNNHFKENVDWEWLRSSFGFEAYPEVIEAVENKTLNFDPHSVYLGTFAETGLVGFLGLIYFFFKYMSLLIKRFTKDRNLGLEKIVSGCILAGFIGFLLNGLTIDILSMRHFWFMIAVGIIGINLNKKSLEC